MRGEAAAANSHCDHVTVHVCCSMERDAEFMRKRIPFFEKRVKFRAAQLLKSCAQQVTRKEGNKKWWETEGREKTMSQ
jgi:hypothetical protein